MKIILVGGARPNFMKIAPIIWELEKRKGKKKKEIKYLFLHTGQHYDEEMSILLLKDLNLPIPDINLGVGSASHAVQTANIMIEFEKVCLREKPSIVIVVGDVNSTIACTLVAVKLGIKTAHIEAGLRSFDRTMPEEINRILTDSISDYLFTTCEDANNNLKKEGIPDEKIFFVGNVMIDSLKRYIKKAENLNLSEIYGLSKSNYAILTLHRPSNVDDKKSLKEILGAIREVSKIIPIFFPVHPRTQNAIIKFGLNSYLTKRHSVICSKPLSYLEFLSLMINTKFILTDSGGIQEETTALHIPCLTLRNNTERPITIKEGTNIVVGSDRNRIINESLKILNGNKNKHSLMPKFWDGKAAGRIVDILVKKCSDNKSY